MTLAAALPLVSVLWMTPLALAHDTRHSSEQRRSWSDASTYRDPSTGRYRDSYRDPATGRYRDQYCDPSTGLTNWVGCHPDEASWEEGRRHRRYHQRTPWRWRPEREDRRYGEQPQPFVMQSTPDHD